LNDLEYDEDLEGISEEIDLEISDIDDISDYSKESTYSIVDVAIEKEKLDTSKLPKNAKMSQLLDNSVSSIRANDLSLIPGLLTSPLQSDNSNKCHNYSEQLLPAYPPFPDSVSVNAITSTLGNNEIDQSIDLDEVTIDRSGAEDSFSRLADKIKNLSMPRIEAPNYEPEDEDYSPPSIITPTIANLLAMQGRVNEAIDAYEKLIIDDPENSSSYLSQIESLKNK
jgi:tetratricopeptide (TPR) repeat protein